MSRTAEWRTSILAKRAVCRCCLSNQQHQMCLVISHEISSGLSVGRSMHDLLHLEVVEGDGLPNTVCRQCLSKLVDFRAFKQKCVESATLLEKFVRDVNVQEDQCQSKEDEERFVSVDECISDDRIDEDSQQVTAVFIPLSDILPVENLWDEEQEMEAGSMEADDMKTGEEKFLARSVSLEGLSSCTLADPLEDSWNEEQEMEAGSTEADAMKTGEEKFSGRSASLEGLSSCAAANPLEDSCYGVKEVNSTSVKEEILNERGDSDGECNAGTVHMDESTDYEEEKNSSAGIPSSCQKSAKRNKSRLSSVNPQQCHSREADNVDVESEPTLSIFPRVSLSEDDVYICDNCGIRFSDKNELAGHLQIHVPEVLAVLEGEVSEHKRDQPSSTAMVLRKSRPVHRKVNERLKRKEVGRQQTKCSKEKRFKCEHCDKAFYTKGLLKRHSNIHTCKKLNKCTVCGREFNQKFKLQHHLLLHGEEKRFKCEVCGRRFKLKRYMVTHLRIHSDAGKYKCSLCSKTYHTLDRLKLHSVVHTGKKLYKCSVCDMEFYRKDHYQRHMDSHGGVKHFKCSECGKGFFGNYNLNRHLRVHTGEKPFQCDICGKQYSDKRNLQDHRTEHFGVKAHRCEICGVSFRWKCNYTDHMRSLHSGRIPYKCDVCGKEFQRREYLKIHVNRHFR